MIMVKILTIACFPRCDIPIHEDLKQSFDVAIVSFSPVWDGSDDDIGRWQLVVILTESGPDSAFEFISLDIIAKSF